MKINSLKIIIIIFVLFVISGGVFFIVENSKKKEEESQEISYKIVNMITELRLGISDFDNMHPYITKNREIIYIDQLIFEPLLTVTQDYKITNCLAKEWSKLGETSYLIKLKENVMWQDNSEFTAKDVKFSIEQLKKLDTSIYYENVKNIKTVDIIDNYTVRIELTQEVPLFEYTLVFPIISSKQYKNTNIYNSNKMPLGTGKYKISAIEENKIELEKNNKYRNIDTEDCNFKTISINIYDSSGKVYNAFKLGSIDLIHTNNNKIEEYIGTMGYGKRIYPNREYDYLALNCQNGVLQFKEVRQAINKIIDKEKITISVLENKATVANYSISNNNYLLKDYIYKSSNAEKAKEVLKDGGWKFEYGIWQKEINGTTKTINIDLAVNKNNAQRIKVAEEIKSQLEEVGIKVNIEKISQTQYENYLKNHQYEMLLTGIYTSISPDLNELLGKGNLANYENEEIISILKDLNSIKDEEIIKEKYNKIFEIYDQDVPYIGLYYNNDLIAYSTNLLGDINPNWYSIFYNFSNWYRQ